MGVLQRLRHEVGSTTPGALITTRRPWCRAKDFTRQGLFRDQPSEMGGSVSEDQTGH